MVKKMENDAYRKATDNVDKGWCCAESVLIVIAQEAGIASELIPKIATGLCSGISETCGMCGALSGGILALSLLYGRERCGESVEKNYNAVKKLISKFEKKFGSTNCKKLISCDLGTPEGKRKFKQNNRHLDCREYTGQTAQFVSEIIAESRDI